WVVARFGQAGHVGGWTRQTIVPEDHRLALRTARLLRRHKGQDDRFAFGQRLASARCLLLAVQLQEAETIPELFQLGIVAETKSGGGEDGSRILFLAEEAEAIGDFINHAHVVRRQVSRGDKGPIGRLVPPKTKTNLTVAGPIARFIGFMFERLAK